MRRAALPPLLLALLFVALVAPVIASDLTEGPAGADDERIFHLNTIFKLAIELPEPDIKDIWTATTPGLHLPLAVFARWVSDDPTTIEAVAALFSLGMVMAAYFLIRRYADPWLALLLTLPLMLSHYVLQSAGWVNTDNTALLFVLLTIGVALRFETSPRGLAPASAFLFLAVWVRQLALWAAAPLVVAGAIAGRVLPPRLRGDEGGAGPPTPRPALLALLAAVPAIVSLAILAAVWGQLTPPLFASQSGTSPAAIPFTLAIAGMFGPAFVLCAAAREDLRGRAPLVAAGLGVVVALLPPTSETEELQRRTGGGLWRVVDSTPVVADRSVVLALLAPVGAVALLVLWRAAARHAMAAPATVVLASVAALALAQAGTVRTYQRYFEPLILVALALLVAFGPLTRSPDEAVRERLRRRTLVLIGALCALQLVGCVTVVYSRVF